MRCSCRIDWPRRNWRCAAASANERGWLKLKRRAHAFAAAIQHMSINHGRADIFVTQQFLNGANIISRFEQMRSEAMA